MSQPQLKNTTISNLHMRCARCQRKFRDRKALLCHMNHPFGACYSHFQEVADLADELQRYKNRPREIDNNVQPMDLRPDMDVDATFTEHDDLGGNDWRMDGELFVEEYEGAAKEYGTGTTFMDEFDCDQYAGERIINLYYPFASRDEWEFAAFLLRSDLSMASIDSLLSLNLVIVTCNFDRSYSYLCSAQVKCLKLSFGTAKKLRGLAEMLPKGPVWQCKVWNTVYPTKKKLTLFYRDPLECIQSILHSPLMKDYIKFKPLRIFESASRAMRIYTEWLTGNAAWSMQVSSRHQKISFPFLRSCRANCPMGQHSLGLSYHPTRPIYLQ
jgi:hypothetical protein